LCRREERGVGCAVEFVLFAALVVLVVVAVVAVVFLLAQHWL
jgi:Flp pilus assembly pilin Flp